MTQQLFSFTVPPPPRCTKEQSVHKQRWKRIGTQVQNIEETPAEDVRAQVALWLPRHEPARSTSRQAKWKEKERERGGRREGEGEGGGGRALPLLPRRKDVESQRSETNNQTNNKREKESINEAERGRERKRKTEITDRARRKD